MGGSTPAVWGDRIFLTCQDGDHIALLCVGTDGKELWRKPVGPGGGKIRGDEGNGASASPSTDGKHVYVFIGSGELACYDFDGNEIWKFNVQERYGKFQMQLGLPLHARCWTATACTCSCSTPAPISLVALNKATGEEVWKVERKSDGRGENEAVLRLAGDLAQGQRRLPDRARRRLRHGPPPDGRLGDLARRRPEPEGPAPAGPAFRRLAGGLARPDRRAVGKDGPVVGGQAGRHGHGRNRRPVRGSGGWPSGTPDVPSPLVHDGLVYLCKEDGYLVCLDAKTGEEKYNQRMHSSLYRASPVYADGNVYLTAKDGVVDGRQGGADVREGRGEHAARPVPGVAGGVRRPHLSARLRRPVCDWSGGEMRDDSARLAATRRGAQPALPLRVAAKRRSHSTSSPGGVMRLTGCFSAWPSLG